MKMTIYLALLLIGYSLRAQDLTQLRDQDQIRDYLKLEDKDLLQIRDQDRIHLTDRITLLDGTVVNADGTYRTADGDRLRLRDGECMDLDGNKYASEEQFRQHLQYRLQAMNQLHFAFHEGKAFQVQQSTETQVQERVVLRFREQKEIRAREIRERRPETRRRTSE